LSATLLILLLLWDVVVFVVLVRCILAWMYTSWDMLDLRRTLRLLETVTNPLLYPVRHVMPEEKRHHNVPEAVGIVVLVVIWVVLLASVRLTL
jgi:uncharacterized protein YggT (Ycf19 family)